MNYKLAKQLEDAGFPTKHYVGARFYANHNENVIVSESPYGGEYKFRDNETYIPTLEELIEACGESYFELGHVGIERAKHSGSYWLASKDQKHGRGLTPTEAVAHLYLALKNKL